MSTLEGSICCPVPGLISWGGGYLDAGRQHSGGIVQIEYKWDRLYYTILRPQTTISFPNVNAVYAGLNIAAEIYFSEYLVFSPNFGSGLYYTKHGRDLGYWLEFRSALELAYEWKSGIRLGFQFWHISNASIGKRNPGENAALIFLAYPFP